MAHNQHQAATILLVEDEGIIRMASAAMLEDAGYQVLEAVNGVEALHALAAHPEIDVVVTDVQMPGKLDGLQLAGIIARDYPRVHTLVTSGRASPKDARESGATTYLAKPYTAEAIQSAVESVLAA